MHCWPLVNSDRRRLGKIPFVCCLHWPYRRQASSHRYCTGFEAYAVEVGATVLYCLCWPHRRQAGSHRYCTGFEAYAVEVGATVLYCLCWPHRRQAGSHRYCTGLEVLCGRGGSWLAGDRASAGHAYSCPPIHYPDEPCCYPGPCLDSFHSSSRQGQPPCKTAS